MNRIPFFPLPPSKAKGIIKKLLGFGEVLSKAFPSLEFELEQAEIDYEAREWMTIAFFCFLFYFFLMFVLIFVISTALNVIFARSVLVSLLASLFLGGSTYMYLAFYPKLKVGRKVKNLERNLPFALHHLLIQIRSGVSLFNLIVSVARGNYGLLSREFSKAVTEINTGLSEIAALETLARENPSLYFRRIMWQLVNALKSGADISTTVKEIVDNVLIDQRVAIKRYGASLNPLALFYMVMVVIFPTLGIVFILIMSSFVGLPFSLEFILLGIIGFLVLVQFMFIGMVKTRRPAVI